MPHNLIGILLNRCQQNSIGYNQFTTISIPYRKTNNLLTSKLYPNTNLIIHQKDGLFQ